MTFPIRNVALFGFVALLFVAEGTLDFGFFSGSWNTSLAILNMALISAIMALGVNLQWGFAGLFNIGITGFVALGGLAAVLIAMPPTPGAWGAGGLSIMLGLVLGAATVFAAVMTFAKMAPGRVRALALVAILGIGFYVFRWVFDGGVAAVEGVSPANFGYLGGLNFGGLDGYRDAPWKYMVLLAWPVGGILAAGAAWLIGKTALGLRSDYLAIATLGIGEIIIAILKNEDWLSRGVKNVIGIPRPTWNEIDLQNSEAFVARAASFGLDPVEGSTLLVKASYSLLFAGVLLIILVLAQLALASPWGRMMRAIRDNEVAAEAMGKDVTARHLQIFVLGSAICGVAGAMMITLDSQLTPTAYQPLRYTFLIWVMVIVGGSGNNFGAVLGGFLIWYLWVQVEPMGFLLMEGITAGMADDSPLRERLFESVAHMRLLTMGLVMLLVLRFAPRGMIPEK